MFKKIVIVGGGFGGWYTVASLQLQFPDLEITLIESPNVPRLQVGESLGFDSVYAWKRHLGLDNDTELMRQTGAIYKFGVYNVNFYRDNEQIGHAKGFNLKTKALTSFYNQFEYPDYYEHWSKELGDVGVIDAWLYLNRNNKQKNPHEFFDEIGDSSFFCSSTSVPFNSRNQLTIRNNDGYSYHTDAEEMISFIKSLVFQRAKENTFLHIVGNVSDVETDINNNITNLILADGRQVHNADVYFDCTGFSRVLSKKTHQGLWQDFEGYNNSAWVCPTKYADPEKELTCATTLIGEDYGWRFQVNLYHRQGNGYVYNDELTDDSTIGDYFNNITESQQLASPRLIKWQPGMYNKGWVGNCIALGVASGFFDPWDAPTFTEHSRDLEKFSSLMKKYNNQQILLKDAKENYNQQRTLSLGERQIRITVAHGLSKRAGPYWDYVRQRAKDADILDTLRNLLLDPNYLINTILPFYWQQFYIRIAVLTNTDTSQWNFSSSEKFNKISESDLEMAKSFFKFNLARNKYIRSQKWPNAYLWLKEHRFNGATSQEIYEDYRRRTLI